MKGYKLYDIQSNQIFVSRDVIFHEEIFPFHSMVISDELVDQFPDLGLPISSLEVPDNSQQSVPILDISGITQPTDSLAPDSSVLILDTSDIAQHADSLVHNAPISIPFIQVPI